MAMKSMKNLFRKSKKDKKNDDTSQSQDGEENLVTEESAEFERTESEHTVSFSDNASLCKSIHDDGTVQSDMKSQTTSTSAIQRRLGPRKSRRALREESKRALAMEFASSNHSTNASSDSGDGCLDDAEDDGPGVFIEIPVSINTEKKNDTSLKTGSRSRSRDGRRSQGRAASRSRDRLAPRPPKSQMLSSRSRSSDRRRSQRGNSTGEDEPAAKSATSTDPETSSVAADKKAFLSQLQKATEEKGNGSENNQPNENRDSDKQAPSSQSVESVGDKEQPEKTESELEKKESGNEDHPMGKVTRERRARRSDSRDGRRRARSGSRDRPLSGNDDKEKRRSHRSVSRDGKPRSSNRDRRQRSRSRDINVSSSRSESKDRLSTTSHHSAASSNRSKSTDRRGMRKTKSIISKESKDGMKMLFGEGQQDVRRHSADETVIASNINKLIEGGELSDAKTAVEDAKSLAKESANKLLSPTNPIVESNDGKNSTLCSSKECETMRSTSSGQRHEISGGPSSRGRRSPNDENTGLVLASTSVIDVAPTERDPATGVKTSASENEKQVQTVSVVFKSECNVDDKTQSEVDEKHETQEEDDVTPASTLLSLLGGQAMSSTTSESAWKSKESTSTSQPRPNLESIEAAKESEGKASSAETQKHEGEDKDRLSEREKRRAARKARREQKERATEAASKSSVPKSNLEALLGMIGSSANDFKDTNISNSEELFDAQPISSVDFFQSLSAPSEEIKNKLSGSPTERKRGVARSKSSDDATNLTGKTIGSGDRKRGVVRTKSSDDANDLAGQASSSRNSRKHQSKASLRNILSQSDHVTDRRRKHESETDDASLPPPSLAGDICSKSSKGSRKIQRQTIAEEKDEEYCPHPPSLAGDSFVKKKPKGGGIKTVPIDAFELLGGSVIPEDDGVESTTTSKIGESGSRKIRRSKVAPENGECEESLAPPSLAGDVMPSSTRNKKISGLRAVSESNAEDFGNEAQLPKITRMMSKTAKSFAVLQCDEEDDDSFVNDLVGGGSVEEESKKKRRGSMMKSMKKATSALDVIEKSSKGVASKTKSARNVLEQATTKVFSRKKVEGKGLLKHNE